MLSFSETSEQLIPHTRISVDGMRNCASLLSYVTTEGLSVIMAAGHNEDTIYQVVYDPKKESLSQSPSIVSNTFTLTTGIRNHLLSTDKTTVV